MKSLQVIEEEHQEKDSTTGRETHRMSHGLHDKVSIEFFCCKKSCDMRTDRDLKSSSSL